MTGASGEVAGTTVAATRERREPRATRNTGASVWYRWTAPRSGWFTFESCGGFEMVVGVYRGAALRSLRRLGTSSNACSSSGGANVLAERGVEYRVVVTGFGSGTGDFSLAWRATPAPACVVPYVVEFPLADARRMITDRHCTVVVRYVTSTLLRPGRVVGQSPRSGTKLRYGATVTIEIARR